MRVRFTQASSRNLNELSIFAKSLQIWCANVAHAGAKTAVHLVNDVGYAALVSNATFDSFRNKLVCFVDTALEVAVCRTVCRIHGAKTAHA